MPAEIELQTNAKAPDMDRREERDVPGPRGLTLGFKLTLLVGLTVAVLIAVLLAAGFGFGRELLREEIDAHLSAVASSRRDMVLAHIAQLQQEADLRTERGEFRGLLHNVRLNKPDPTNTGYSQAWLNELTDHRGIYSASLVDSTGQVVLADKDTPTGGNVSEDPAFIHGMTGAFVGTPGMMGEHFVVALAAPVLSYDHPRKKVGVLMMTKDVSALAMAIRDTTGLGRTGEVLLVVREGKGWRTLFPPRGQTRAMTGPLASAPVMDAVLGGRSFLGTTYDDAGKSVLVAALPVGYEGWGLVAKMDSDEAYAPISRALRSILLCGAIVTIAGLGAAYLVARSMARPVERLVGATSRVADGDYETSLPVESEDEFGLLTRRFNEMTAAIRQRGIERDMKEAALQESELRLKAIGDHLPGSTIYEYGMRPDGSGFFTYLSAAIQRSSGYTVAELFENAELLYENVVKEDLSQMMKATQESARSLTIYDQKVRRRMRDGSIRWFHSRSMPRRLDDGSVVWDGVELDITEAKRAEEALRDSDECLRQVMDVVPHAIFAKDGDGRFLFANRACADLVGKELQDVVGRTDAEVHGYSEEVASYLRGDEEVRSSGSPKFISEERHTDRNGNVRFLQTIKVPFSGPGADKPGVLGVSMDITDRKRAEEEKQRTEVKLLDMQKLESLGVLAGGIAHDFNNLLTGIIGNVSILQMDLADGAAIAAPLGEIMQAAQHAAELCQQMLAYAGKGRFVLRDLDLSALVRETAQLLERSIAKGVTLEYHLGSALRPVRGDPSQLRQVVMNLVINASEAVGNRDGLIGISTSSLRADRALLDATYGARDLPEGEYIQLEVTDNGQGMSPETIAKIFDPFFTTKFTGRGMGLAAVLGIVRGHRGVLKVDSISGKGTCFKILFPSADAPVATGEAPKEGAEPWRSSGLVVVADDEESVRKVTVRMLQAFGFTVLAATDGEEALELFRTAPGEVRVVLLDLTMPRLDGEATFRELRRLDPSVRVVLMSGYNEQEADHRFVDQGLAGFLQKPFAMEQLRQRLKEILA